MKIVKAQVEEIGSGPETRAVVVLESERGSSGTGEVAGAQLPRALRAELEFTLPKLLGRDPLNRNSILADLASGAADAPSPAAMSCIEAACLDLAGKELGVPACQFLGGPVRPQLRVCASDWQIDSSTPELLALKAVEIAGAGFTALEVDPFANDMRYMRAPDIERAIDCVRRIRESLGNGIDLIVDAKGRFTAPEAIRIADAIQPLQILYMQDPVRCDDLAALQEMRRATPISVAVSRYAANGAGIRQLIERQLADFIHLDCSRIGGASRAREFALMAETWFINVTLHHRGGPAAWALNAQIAASSPNCTMLDLPWPVPIDWSEACGAQLKPENGTISLLDGPGMGIPCDQTTRRSTVNAGT